MNSEIRAVLVKAGWRPGRRVSPSQWIQPLEEEGFQFNGAALEILSEFGGLKIVGLLRDGIQSAMEFDPFDAAGGSVDEAEMLMEDYGEVYSPIGSWSARDGAGCLVADR
ncbi:SUKH-3 domain-containing protein [Streptosporangiaceae bacterium NEAU-GS5]|nr:SUKH-3 domain-containing protein [Streptosporangiaceae bacterium NEAU-GS5]